MGKVNVLGVKIDDISSDEALEKVKDWLKGKGKHYIVTPNPEFLVAAEKDQVFRKLLNDADLSIPDGVGLKLSGKVKNVTYGTDFMEKLVALSADYGFTVGFLGGREGVAKKAAECLRKKYPKLTVKYALSGPVIPAKAGIYSDRDLWIPDQVRDDKVDLLFVAFGQVKQEKWIAKNLKNIPVRVAMGVGGAFDYLSGEVIRAPKIIRGLGLEWLFRLILQPWRIKRQLALIKYLLLIFR